MNTAAWAALVTTGICVGGPALLAAGLLAWNRNRVIDTPDELFVVDAEDHDDTPSPEEELMLAQVEGFLADERMRHELALVDDLDLPIKLKQAIRRRVINGENLRDVYNTALNQERES